MHQHLSTTLAGLLLASLLPAQRTLIGFATDSATTNPNVIARQVLCTPGERVCPTGMATPASPWAGGAAYNALRRSVWHTQGTRMSEVRIDDCQLLCSAAANLTLGNGSLCTGLEICESRHAMYALESTAGVAALTVWDIRACPPQVRNTCSFTLPTRSHIAGAVAVDEREGRIFYAASLWTTAVPQNFVLVARLGDPCNILCRFPVDTCGNRGMVAITGMTYDACDGLLYVTDGSQTAVLRTRPTSPCDFVAVACCERSPAIATYGWHGIDIEPPHAEPVGASCTGLNCPSCPSMRLSVRGDAVIGNPEFALEVHDAPSPSVFFAALSPGQCRVPGLPVFCGRWHTDLSGVVFLPGIALTGAAGCNGDATLPLPIPYDYALCRAVLCAQGIVACRNATALGFGLTNSVEIHID